jgi:hypothetical protein
VKLWLDDVSKIGGGFLAAQLRLERLGTIHGNSHSLKQNPQKTVRLLRIGTSQSEPFNNRELALHALLGFSYQETLFPQLFLQRRHKRDSAWEEKYTLLREENGPFSGLKPKEAWVGQVWVLAPFA